MTISFQKLKKIRDEFPPSKDSLRFDGNDISNPLGSFHPVTAQYVERIIKASSNSSCALDPIPTSVLKQCTDEMIPTLQQIINKSLVNSQVPNELKHAIILPRVKKVGQSLEPTNYRPVSNLPYLSKLLEQSAIDQLDSHFKSNGLYEKYQSAYKPRHSTETALIHITNSLLQSMDKNHVIFLALLDLSAAFDVVDHELMLQRFEKSQGVNDQVLSWIESYLSNRTQQTCIDGQLSSKRDLQCGFPQGSKMGPRLYQKYTEPLGKLVQSAILLYHFYADDSQLWKSAKATSTEAIINAKKRLESGLHLIAEWMCDNKLKLNQSKTEFLIIGSDKNRKNVEEQFIDFGTERVFSVPTATNLGITIDERMSFLPQIAKVVKSCRFYIHKIWKIRKYLLTKTAKDVLLVYKALNGLAPEYMTEMLKPYKPSRTLRSSEKNLLEEPRYRLKSFGLRSFEVAAPRLWNTLSPSIRNSASVTIFKKRT